MQPFRALKSRRQDSLLFINKYLHSLIHTPRGGPHFPRRSWSSASVPTLSAHRDGGPPVISRPSSSLRSLNLARVRASSTSRGSDAGHRAATHFLPHHAHARPPAAPAAVLGGSRAAPGPATCLVSGQSPSGRPVARLPVSPAPALAASAASKPPTLRPSGAEELSLLRPGERADVWAQ